jgi:hypothetical protein
VDFEKGDLTHFWSTSWRHEKWFSKWGIFIPTLKQVAGFIEIEFYFLSNYFPLKERGWKLFAQSIWFKTFLLFISSMGAKMLKFPIVERQEINLVSKIKVFVGSKIWYFNKFYFFSIFQKFGLLQSSPLKKNLVPRFIS